MAVPVRRLATVVAAAATVVSLAGCSSGGGRDSTEIGRAHV